MVMLAEACRSFQSKVATALGEANSATAIISFTEMRHGPGGLTRTMEPRAGR